MLLNFLCIATIFFSATGTANQNFVISHAPHYEVDNYKHIIRKAYRELGINVTFVELPAERRFISLSKGLVDADLGAHRLLSNVYENLIYIDVQIADFSVYLWCRNKPCGEVVIRNPQMTIYTTIYGKSLIDKEFGSGINAKIILVENFKSILDMFVLKRVDFIAYGTSKDKSEHEKQYGGVLHKMASNPIFHVIHEKHAGIANRLEISIRKQLAQTHLPTTSR